MMSLRLPFPKTTNMAVVICWLFQGHVKGFVQACTAGFLVKVRVGSGVRLERDSRVVPRSPVLCV